jgi:ribonuclease BN (tRNA processing enzyme)
MSIAVQLLPTSIEDTSQVQPLTSFLINDTIALDAGCLGFSLPPEKLAQLEHVVLTHSHLDHTLSLPIAIDAAYSQLDHPLCVHGLSLTLAAVHKNLFNEDVWVDFTQFNLLNSPKPCLEFKTIASDPFQIGGLKFTPIPVNHTVPTVGYLIESPTAAVVYTSDTWKTDEIWRVAAKAKNLQAIFTECSYPDEMPDLAQRAGHLTPKLVAEETAKVGRSVPVYCMHVKAAFREKILPQLEAYAARGIELMQVGKVYQFG